MLLGEVPLLGKSGGRLGMETSRIWGTEKCGVVELTAESSSGTYDIDLKTFKVVQKAVVVDARFKHSQRAW